MEDAATLAGSAMALGVRGQTLPPATVAVPVRDEERSLAQLLDSLLQQTTPPSEIVLADGGSSDRTAEVATAYTGRGVRLLQIGAAFPGRGRNAAIAAAETDWVALIDAGCVADPRWLENLLGVAASDPGLDGVFGDFRPLLFTEWDRAQALALVPARQRDDGIHPPVLVSALIRKDAWKRVGGFREDLRAAEDLIFLRALADSGCRVARSPAALVYWQLAPGPAAAFRRLRIYSFHHWRAGLGHTWHMRVMLMDVVALALLAVSIGSPIYLSVLSGAFVVRVVVTAWRRRGNVPDSRPLRLSRLWRVGLLLILADTAAWWGAGRHWASR